MTRLIYNERGLLPVYRHSDASETTRTAADLVKAEPELGQQWSAADLASTTASQIGSTDNTARAFCLDKAAAESSLSQNRQNEALQAAARLLLQNQQSEALQTAAPEAAMSTGSETERPALQDALVTLEEVLPAEPQLLNHLMGLGEAKDIGQAIVKREWSAAAGACLSLAAAACGLPQFAVGCIGGAASVGAKWLLGKLAADQPDKKLEVAAARYKAMDEADRAKFVQHLMTRSMANALPSLERVAASNPDALIHDEARALDDLGNRIARLERRLQYYWEVQALHKRRP